MGAKVTEWILGIIFLVGGIAVVIGGIFLYNSNTKFKEVAIPTTATVVSVSKHTDTDDDTTYTIYVKYFINEKEYHGNYSTSSYVFEGDTVNIYYDKNNPYKIKNSISNVGPIIMTVMGIICGGVGFGIVINKILKITKKSSLLENGELVIANLEEITMNYSYSVNDRHPWIIICSGEDAITGEKYTFKSENIWYNPEPIIQEKNITTFNVYVDKNNHKRYYVSLDDLKRK